MAPAPFRALHLDPLRYIPKARASALCSSERLSWPLAASRRRPGPRPACLQRVPLRRLRGGGSDGTGDTEQSGLPSFSQSPQPAAGQRHKVGSRRSPGEARLRTWSARRQPSSWAPPGRRLFPSPSHTGRYRVSNLGPGLANAPGLSPSLWRPHAPHGTLSSSSSSRETPGSSRSL